ncbi:MAG: tetratricopeptide repeat protein [Verrucomicrobia bacterium]|nr:tetratricopeptide repeat protein [Verrucomicrobiota bacterium]
MDALARHRQLATQFPDNELARFSLGRALLDQGNPAEARGHLGAALARKPDWMAVQILIGKCDLELGRIAEARAAFLKARDLAIAQHHEGPLAEVEGLLSDLPESSGTTEA